MTTGLPILRSLIIYAICVPVAIMLGYLVAMPLDWSSLWLIVGVLAVLAIPLLLKWHQPLLLLVWNANAVAFFIPGRPWFWMLIAGTSLTISILQRTMVQRMRFLHVPSISWPLLFLAVVLIFTGKVTGGIGFHIFGSDTFGGRKYLEALCAILAYFALTVRRFPPHKAFLYCGLFYLGALSTAAGSFITVINPAFVFLYWLFPPSDIGGVHAEVARFISLAPAAGAVVAFMLARYGLRGILFEGKRWRQAVVILCLGIGLFGGFRSWLISMLVLFGVLSLLEGLWKSRLAPALILGGLLAAVLTLAFLPHLPLGVQRSFAFLPGIRIDPMVRMSAETSSEWRLQIWRDALPEVPKYLLLGKGYALKSTEFALEHNAEESSGQGALQSGDFHNGLLSILIPLGVWGFIGFLWFLWAGLRLLYFNYKYGDPAFATINRMLFASFIMQILMFFVVFGALCTDLAKFIGMLGFSIALNGGMLRPARAPVRARSLPIRLRAPLRRIPAPARQPSL